MKLDANKLLRDAVGRFSPVHQTSYARVSLIRSVDEAPLNIIGWKLSYDTRWSKVKISIPCPQTTSGDFVTRISLEQNGQAEIVNLKKEIQLDFDENPETALDFALMARSHILLFPAPTLGNRVYSIHFTLYDISSHVVEKINGEHILLDQSTAPCVVG